LRNELDDDVLEVLAGSEFDGRAGQGRGGRAFTARQVAGAGGRQPVDAGLEIVEEESSIGIAGRGIEAHGGRIRHSVDLFGGLPEAIESDLRLAERRSGAEADYLAFQFALTVRRIGRLRERESRKGERS